MRVELCYCCADVSRSAEGLKCIFKAVEVECADEAIAKFFYANERPLFWSGRLSSEFSLVKDRRRNRLGHERATKFGIINYS